ANVLGFAHTGTSTSWADPGNVYGPGYATTIVGAGLQSGNLDVTNVQYALPLNAVPSGIGVQIYGMSDTPGQLRDATVQLLKGGVPVGQNKALSGSPWPTSMPSSPTAYGGTGDLWGASWTRKDVVSSDFGVRIAVQSAGAGPIVASVDRVDI